MADPRPLRRSQRLWGEGPEVGSRESFNNLTPLRRFRPSAFTIDPEARDVDSPRKHRRTKPLSIEEISDSFDPSYQPFPFFDPNSPTFRIAAPPLSMEGSSSTTSSPATFSTESASPAHTTDMVTPAHIQGSDVSSTPTVSSIRAMVSTMLGTPLGSARTTSLFTLGASHQSSTGSLFASSTVDPSIPQFPGAQQGISSGSPFSSTTSLPPATPFPGTFSMWSSP